MQSNSYNHSGQPPASQYSQPQYQSQQSQIYQQPLSNGPGADDDSQRSVRLLYMYIAAISSLIQKQLPECSIVCIFVRNFNFNLLSFIMDH